MAREKDVEDWRETFEDGKFPLYLSDFLFHKVCLFICLLNLFICWLFDGSTKSASLLHQDGAQEREKSFKFEGELECNVPAPPIKVIQCGLVHPIYRATRSKARPKD